MNHFKWTTWNEEALLETMPLTTKECTVIVNHLKLTTWNDRPVIEALLETMPLGSTYCGPTWISVIRMNHWKCTTWNDPLEPPVMRRLLETVHTFIIAYTVYILQDHKIIIFYAYRLIYSYRCKVNNRIYILPTVKMNYAIL